MSQITQSDISDRLLEFAARIGRTVDALPDTRMGRHIAGQLVRSGTSPAPNYAEACAAESRRDFVHKLSICLKELRESEAKHPIEDVGARLREMMPWITKNKLVDKDKN